MQLSRGTIFLVAVAAIAIAALGMNVAQMVRAGEGGSAGAPAVPSIMSYQGLLSDPDTGQPVADGTYNMSFSIFDAAAGGTVLWEEPGVGSIAVDVSGGLFTYLLGSDVPLTGAVFESGDTYLQVFVNGETLSPRQPVTTVAYALVAQQAATASTIDGVSLAGLDGRFVNNRGGDFPRPNYDSGFFAIAQGVGEAVTLSHNLGGNIDNYFVEMTCKSSIGKGTSLGVGMDRYELTHPSEDSETNFRGHAWSDLDTSQVRVSRASSDTSCVEARMRIWVMPPPFILPPIIFLP